MRFAAAIANRHGRLGVAIRRLDLILARRAPREVSRLVRQDNRVHNVMSWTANFLRRESSPAQPNKIAARPAAEDLTRPVVRRNGSLTAIPSSTVKPAAAGKLTERIASRRLRLESVDGMRAAAMRRSPQMTPPIAAAVAPTLEVRRLDLPLSKPRRSAPVQNAPQSSITESVGSRSDTRQLRGQQQRGLDAKKVMPSLADHEVERIADRVMGSLDRRIVAQRERMGRS
jgi:phosphopantothenoylcysteine synthetase/decarboxylase